MSEGQAERISMKVWIILVFVLVLMAFMWTTAVLLLIGFLPTLSAFYSERRREKSATLSMAPFNLLGILPFVQLLWRDGQSVQAMLAIVTTPFNLMVMYGTAAIGWAIYRIVPSFVVSALMHQAEKDAKAKEEYLKTLRDMWGDDIAR